jgi:Lar family restriction alleviation protein
MTKISEELLPCPFCGGAAKIVHHHKYAVTARCMACECDGPDVETEAEAIAAWNLRTIPTFCDRCSSPVACKDGCQISPSKRALRTSPPPSGEAGEVVERVQKARAAIASLVPDYANRADDTDNQAGFRNAIEQGLWYIDKALLPTIEEPTDE